jgi:hypothetical protein
MFVALLLTVAQASSASSGDGFTIGAATPFARPATPLYRADAPSTMQVVRLEPAAAIMIAFAIAAASLTVWALERLLARRRKVVLRLALLRDIGLHVQVTRNLYLRAVVVGQ